MRILGSFITFITPTLYQIANCQPEEIFTIPTSKIGYSDEAINLVCVLSCGHYLAYICCVEGTISLFQYFDEDLNLRGKVRSKKFLV